MKSRNNKPDAIPENFSTYEAAGAFWDSHSTADYPEHLKPAKIEVKIEKRHFEIEVDENVFNKLEKQARTQKTSARRLANSILRENLVTA